MAAEPVIALEPTDPEAELTTGPMAVAPVPTTAVEPEATEAT